MILQQLLKFFELVLKNIKLLCTKSCSILKIILFCGPSNASKNLHHLADGFDLSNQVPVQNLNRQKENNSAKTPNSFKLKLYSLATRLSVRNFMDYCVSSFDFATIQGTLWLLGTKYDLPNDLEAFSNDVRSKIWMTYRKNFPAIDESGRYTTDRGFGCMIRCGQMVLSNALVYKNLGRDWRWQETALKLNSDVYIKILKLFQDKETSAYSIHSIVKTGESEGRTIGEWFGPNTIAQSLKRLSSSQDVAPENIISVDTALDNIVFIDEIRQRFKKFDWIPGVVFIQLRLGLTKINPIYFSALKKTFQFKNSLGIIGGRPNHALYLIGHVNDEIIYLDPHYTQQFIDLDEETLDDKANEAKLISRDITYHCSNPEKISLDKLDPSLALCFYMHTEQDFDNWCKLSREFLIESEQAPMFEIAETRPKNWQMSKEDNKTVNKTRHDNEMFIILKNSSPSSECPYELQDISRDPAHTEEEFEILG